MARFKNCLTEQNKHDILALFYRTELYSNEKIIDNSDKNIANMLGLKKHLVCDFLASYLVKKVKKFNAKVNSPPSSKPLKP